MNRLQHAHPALLPFIDRIKAQAQAIEDARQFSGPLANEMVAAGLFRLLVPKQFGGLEVHPSVLIDTLISAGAADGAVGWNLMIGNTTGLLSASLPREWAERMYLSNPDAVTVGVTAPLGKAVREGDGLRVSGRWPFGSGSHLATWICGGCQLFEDGIPKPGFHGTPETLLVFFHRDEVIIHDNWHVSGLRGTGSNDIEVKEQLVPEGRWVILGGKPRIDAPLYRFPTLGLLALGVSSVAVGIAERAIDEFITLAGGKVPTGSVRPLANRSRAQQDLAEAEASVAAATAFIHQTVGAIYEHAAAGGKVGMPEKARLRLAATHATWSSVGAVDKLYHASGGSAIYAKNALQRCLRDVHVATQHLMVAQPTLEVVGKVMLGIDPKTLL
jgi:alkylation response protein AidB-like acyl-CoA dehydrogenase